MHFSKTKIKNPPLFLIWNLIYWQLQKNYHSSGSWICQSKDKLNKLHIKLTTMSSPALREVWWSHFCGLWVREGDLSQLPVQSYTNKYWKLSWCVAAISPYHIRVLLHTWYMMHMYCLASIIKMRGSCTYKILFKICKVQFSLLVC